MQLNIWDIFKYIFKWKWLIVGTLVLSIAASYFYVETAQSYSAEMVIRYTDPNVSKGRNPFGEKFDVYEILSPTVIGGAISSLGINASISSIRSNVIITPIIPNNIVELQKSKIKNGEEYEYYPNEFSIKYTVDSSMSGAYARDVLDSIITNYHIYYAEKYLNPTVLPSVDFDISIGNHDYIEIAEIMNSKVADTIEFLNARVGSSNGYRSSSTGYTFSDISRQYNILKSFKIPSLFSNIFSGKVTLDNQVLLKKYAYRVDNLELNRANKTQETNLAYGLMENYVSSSTRNPSTSDGYKSDSENVDNSFYSTEIKPSEATYDDLVKKYATAGVDSLNLAIDAEYSRSIINAFSESNVSEQDKDIYTTKVKNEIGEISARMKDLYSITDLTIRDYNNYLANQHITSLSTVNIMTNLSLNMYLVVAVVMGLGLGIILAIAIEIIKNMRKSNKNKDNNTKTNEDVVVEIDEHPVTGVF